MSTWKKNIRYKHPVIANELIKILDRTEPNLFHCNKCGGVLSLAYFKKQGGVIDDNDENICNNCYEEEDEE